MEDPAGPPPMIATSKSGLLRINSSPLTSDYSQEPWRTRVVVRQTEAASCFGCARSILLRADDAGRLTTNSSASLNACAGTQYVPRYQSVSRNAPRRTPIELLFVQRIGAEYQDGGRQGAALPTRPRARLFWGTWGKSVGCIFRAQDRMEIVAPSFNG